MMTERKEASNGRSSPTMLPSWKYFLHVGALTGLSLTQPIFDLLAQQPQFLVSHQAGLKEILFLVFLFIFLLPATVTGLAEFLDRFLGTKGWARAAAIGPFVFLLILLFGKSFVPLNSQIVLLGSSGILALISILVYRRSSTARLFLTFLSPAIVIIPMFFLMQPSVQWLFAADRPHGPAQIEKPPDNPIFLVVFDELSLNSLLDRRGMIDAEQFPHFADLARSATLYRNTTTVSPQTRLAVPALLTGNIPKGHNREFLPILDNYPNNLFLWLGGSHRLNVFESTSALCPPAWVGKKTAPWRRIRRVLRGLLIVYLHRTLPVGLTSQLPDIRHGWTVPEHERPRKSPPVRQFESFLAAISDAPAPSLNFIHVQMPHVPYLYLPSGKRYVYKGCVGLFTSEGVWKRSEAMVTVAFQRYLLQVGFADRLLGQLLRKLKANRLYGRSLIVVASDHGVSFRPGENRREPDKTNFKDILNVPLLIKAPYQKQGLVSDRPTRTVDILPSIAGILGVSSPWPTDGISVTEAGGEDRDLFTVVPSSRFNVRTMICLDGQTFEESGRNEVRAYLDEVREDDNQIVFHGWAADLWDKKLADSILIFADEELIYRGMPRHIRPGLGEYFQTGRMLDHAAFFIELDRELFAGKSRVRCFARFGSRIRKMYRYPIDYPWSTEPKPGWDKAFYGTFDGPGRCGEDPTRSVLISVPRSFETPVPSIAFMARLQRLKWDRGRDGLFKFGPSELLLGKQLNQLQVTERSGLRIELDHPELYETVRLDSDFIPAAVEGWISVPDVEFVAVSINGTLRTVAPTFDGIAGRRRFQALVPESAFQNGSNRVRTFAVAQTEEGVMLHTPMEN